MRDAICPVMVWGQTRGGGQRGAQRMDELLSRFVADVASMLETASEVLAKAKRTDDLSGWIDQRDERNTLGRNRLCAAARRRIDEAKPGEDPGARKIGRRYLLSPEALREESMRHLTERPGPVKARAKVDEGQAAFERVMARVRAAKRGT